MDPNLKLELGTPPFTLTHSVTYMDSRSPNSYFPILGLTLGDLTFRLRVNLDLDFGLRLINLKRLTPDKTGIYHSLSLRTLSFGMAFCLKMYFIKYFPKLCGCKVYSDPLRCIIPINEGFVLGNERKNRRQIHIGDQFLIFVYRSCDITYHCIA